MSFTILRNKYSETQEMASWREGEPNRDLQEDVSSRSDHQELDTERIAMFFLNVLMPEL